MSDIHINASIYKHASVFAYLHLDLHTSKYGAPKVSIIHIGIISSAGFISKVKVLLFTPYMEEWKTLRQKEK